MEGLSGNLNVENALCEQAFGHPGILGEDEPGIWSCALYPESDYEYDSARDEFEYYDERDHGDDNLQMDIYIPVRKRGR